MSLEDMIQKIRDDAESRYRKRVSEAEAQAKKILEKASADGKDYASKRSRQAAMEARRLSSVKVLRAELEARREVEEAFRKAIDGSLDRLPAELGNFTRTGEYTALLQGLADKIYAELGDGCTISVTKEDIAKIKAHRGCKLDGTAAIQGGVIGSSSDGKSMIDYSLGRLLEDSREGLSYSLMKRLQGKGNV